MLQIEFADGTCDDAESRDEACDTVWSVYPEALLGVDDKFVVPMNGGLATVATLTALVEVDISNAN